MILNCFVFIRNYYILKMVIDETIEQKDESKSIFANRYDINSTESQALFD